MGSRERFFMGKLGDELPVMTPCVELGFDPPFVVQDSHGLLEQGLSLRPLPLNMEELAEAVRSCP